METSERKQDVIISGPNTPQFHTGEDSKCVGEKILKDALKINLPEHSITRAVRIGPKPTNTNTDRRSILLSFSTSDMVQDVIKTAKTVRPDKLYMNENLTPTKHKIMQTLRKCRRLYGEKVSGCSSRYGRVCVWIKPPNSHVEGARNSRMFINSISELTDFCLKVLNVSLETIIAM